MKTQQPELFETYPRIKELGLRTYQKPVPHVKSKQLHVKLKQAGLDRERFNEMFGIQTMTEHGPYPWDVEAVLERMMSGKLTGTQLLWD
jgi:hypothetical protein